MYPPFSYITSLDFLEYLTFLPFSNLNPTLVGFPDFSFIGKFPAFAHKALTESVMGQHGHPGLINRHHGYKFPVDLAEELKVCVKQLPLSVWQLLPNIAAQPYLRSLVYLPAVLAYQSVCPDCIDISPLTPHLVAKLIDFDSDHFSIFFNLIQAYCWQLPTP